MENHPIHWVRFTVTFLLVNNGHKNNNFVFIICPSSQVLKHTFSFDCYFCFMPDETSQKNYFTLSIIIGGEFHLTIKKQLLSDEITNFEAKY